MIEVTDLHVRYTTVAGDHIAALGPVNLTVPAGEFCAVVGPSGCGKSTLLKVLAGLIPHPGGRVLISGEPVSEPRRDIGFVFQAPVLLPWLTVQANVILPLRVQRTANRSSWEGRAQALLTMTGLKDFALRYPGELSGGMQQRAALARALIHDPALLLMDEPFGALDAMTREMMNLELQRIWLQAKKTVIFVTHSIPEAVFLADRVVVMSSRPGTVADVVEVNLPRPRSLDLMNTEAFGTYTRTIRQGLNVQGWVD